MVGFLQRQIRYIEHPLDRQFLRMLIRLSTLAMQDGQKDEAEHQAREAARVGDLVALDSYRRSLGRSKTTFWRYRKRHGWLPSVNILGRVYITRAAIEEFEAAARAGRLASDPRGCAAEGKTNHNRTRMV